MSERELGRYGSSAAREYSAGPSTVDFSNPMHVMLICRPARNVPYGVSNPNQADRPNRRLPLLSAPEFDAKPFSSSKITFIPPPSSSLPRRPHRDGSDPASDAMRTAEPEALVCPGALAAWLSQSTPMSINPYSVTLL